MSLIFATIPPKRLAQGITSASTTFYINNIIGFNTTDSLNVDDTDLGTQHYCVFRNDTGTKIEIMEIDPTTISTGPITIVRRGLSYYGDRTTEVTANKLDWSANETIVQLGTDAPQIFQYLKEYIDAAAIAGAVPASTTAAGIVIRATQTEVDARTTVDGSYDLFARPDTLRATKYHDYIADAGGTDAYAITVVPAITAYATGQEFTFKANTANTGACTLNVCGLGAKTIKKNVSTDLATGDILANQDVKVIYDGTNMQIVSNKKVDYTTDIYNTPTPFFQQDLSLSQNDTVVSGEFASGSMTDGSALFVHINNAQNLYRFQRDTNTGQYYQTHTINPTLQIPSGDNGAIINIGSYIYLFTNDSTNIVCSRFLAADLTGEQVMTVPTVACTAGIGAWTDGVSAYVVSADSDTTSRKWTLSGTTFTADSTATVSAVFSGLETSSMWDGTSAYINRIMLSGDIKKLTDITGTSFSTTSYTEPVISDTQYGSIIINIDSTKMYIGTFYAFYDEVAQVSARIILTPVTKP